MIIATADTDKGRLEYSLHGTGKPVLIVHGGHVNCRETIFQKGLDSENYMFLTPSRPGYGHTLLTEANKTPEGTAELYVALLDKLELKATTVIGISAGGLTAIALAANYPDRVQNLILMSALTKKWFAKTDKTYRGGKLIFDPTFERTVWMLYRLFFTLTPEFMARVMFKSLSTYRPVRYTRDELQELKRMTTNMQSGQGFCNDLDQDIDQETLQTVSCPTLILHSETDKQVSTAHPLNAKDKIKNAKLVTFRNRWGHMLWFGEEYHPVLVELKSFLRS